MPLRELRFEVPNGAPTSATRSAAGDRGGVTYNASFSVLLNRCVISEVALDRNSKVIRRSFEGERAGKIWWPRYLCDVVRTSKDTTEAVFDYDGRAHQ